MVNEPSEKEDLMVIYGFGNIQTMTNNIFYQLTFQEGTEQTFLHFMFLMKRVEQVAREYKGKISTRDFGNLCLNTATEYNNALLIIENNNIGWASIQQIIDRGYDNLFYTSKDLKYVDVEHQLSNKIYREERNMVPGFSTNNEEQDH